MKAEGVSRDMSVTAEMNRRNGRIFFWSNILYYLTGPVLYVGVVQAALCDRLGAHALVANIPASAFGVGSILPFLLFPIIPYRSESAAVVISNWCLTIGLAGVSASLLLPCPTSVRIVAVVAQGMITGLALSISNVYMYQCLGRGTTVEGRARILKLTFSVGPLCAVAAALATHFVLTHGLALQQFRLAFALIFLTAIPCTMAVALLSRRYELIRIEDVQRSGFVKFLGTSITSFVGNRKLVLLWVCYFFWAAAYYTEPNISLHIQQVLGRAPQEFAGLLLFFRFGCKSLAGFAIGALAVRQGIRAPVVATVLLTGAAILWAYGVTGNAYLFAFGFAGAGELANVYFPNYTVSVSAPEHGAGNLSLMRVADALAGFAPLIYGSLAQTHGFELSILAGIVPLVVCLGIVSRLPSRAPESA